MSQVQRSAAVITTAMVLVLGCGSSPSAPPEPTSSSLTNVTPSRSLHLRAAFDDNPAVYVGRFVPPDVKDAELDENRAAQTVCSKFFKVTEVGVNQENDELLYVSSNASGSIMGASAGAVATMQGGATKARVMRVHYKLTKKIQVSSDPEGLAVCCAKNPGACTNQVVGEFLRGTGEIYAATDASRNASADLGVPPVAASASYNDASHWKRLQSFNDTFFAFVPVATGVVNASAQKASDDKVAQLEKSCDFCNHLPESDSGMYFCGVSPPAIEESSGRDAAMQSARQQVIRYLGERIETTSKTLSSTAKGLISDERYTTAVAKGMASWVKDQKHCSEKENSPEHRVVYKVLTFVPNEALASASQKALEEVAAAKGGVTEKDKQDARDAVKKATSK